jgi:23S rRNA pseudouridine2605 synthase
VSDEHAGPDEERHEPAAGGRNDRRDERDEPRGERGGRADEGAGRGRRGGRRDGRGRGEQRNDMTLVVYLARSGVGSRRRCDELIREGTVTIDGAVVTFPREKVGEQAEVAVAGEVVTPREYRYVLVNKPRGVASTRSDPHADRVLVDMVPDGRILFPVGRLDLDTTGLIILTNDGVLANRLMHPRYGVSKTYSARVRGHAGKRALAELRTGIELEDGRTAPAEARVEKQGNKTALVELTIHEGRKHQVRRMLAALGLPVEELHRRRYGPLSDKNLKIGAWRTLSGDEVEALRRAAEEVERSLVGDDPGEAIDLAAPGAGATRQSDARLVSDEASALGDDAPPSSHEASALGDDTPPSSDDQAAPGDDAPSVGGDPAPPGDDAPSAGDDPAPLSDDAPAAGDAPPEGDESPPRPEPQA